MPLSITTTEYYEGLTLAELLDVISDEIGDSIAGTPQYTKFSRTSIIRRLNDRLNKFVFHSQCIRKAAILTCKAGFKNYKLPENCMDGGVIGQPKFFIDKTAYQELYIRDTQWLDNHYQGWLTDPPSQPLYSYTGESYGNIPMLGVYPSPVSDGQNYTILPDLGVVTGLVPGASTNINGIATGGGSTTLIDTGVDFTTMGLTPGISIHNVTDGSTATIVTIAATTLTITALTGGSLNVFTSGDSYTILAGEYGVVTSWAGDDIFLFSSEVGEIANITVPPGNIKVDFIPYPLSFPDTGNNNQLPEIPKLYHMDYAMGVVADLLATFNEKTKEFARAQFYEQKFMQAVALAKAHKESRPFNDKPVQFVPKRRGWRNN